MVLTGAMERRIKLKTLNSHITCKICRGYLIDATTVTECLHTFCKSCLVKHLEEKHTCPTCQIVIHQSHPLQYISFDRTMQDIVYKLVPDLQESENLYSYSYLKNNTKLSIVSITFHFNISWLKTKRELAKTAEKKNPGELYFFYHFQYLQKKKKTSQTLPLYFNIYTKTVRLSYGFSFLNIEYCQYFKILLIILWNSVTNLQPFENCIFLFFRIFWYTLYKFFDSDSFSGSLKCLIPH